MGLSHLFTPGVSMGCFWIVERNGENLEETMKMQKEQNNINRVSNSGTLKSVR